ncbi:MAG: winged helix-turn-helix domain-containing protein [Pyrinomonadaceae bacterium]
MSQGNYRFEQFLVDPQRRLLLREGYPVPMTSKTFDLLLAMIESDGREVTKDALMNRVWPDQMVEDANLTVTMSQLRKALGEKPNEHRLIVTIPGIGYRFVGELEPVEDSPARTDKVSRPTFRPGLISNNGHYPRAHELAFPANAIYGTKTAKRAAARYWLVGLGLFVLLAAVGAVLLYRNVTRPKLPTPFQNISAERLTNTGNVAAATIAPDGKYFAFVERESEGNSLWVQQVSTASKIRVLAPQQAEFWGLNFTPDGRFIYYNLFEGNRVDPELFRIPSLGGASSRIPNVSCISFAFSPDGGRLAYTVSNSAAKVNSLIVANADGSDLHAVAQKPEPNTFEYEGQVVAWSPDGQTIACLVNYFERDSSYTQIVGINVANGTETILCQRHWAEVQSIEWLRTNAGLVVAAKERPNSANQLWFVPCPDGVPRPLTADVTEYSWIKALADGRSFVAMQTNTANSISTGKPAASENDFREVLSEVGPLNPMAWISNKELIYRSVADGGPNLWSITPESKERRQITNSARASELGLCTTPDRKYTVFAAWISGKLDLWRVGSDGLELIQLTDGDADAYPRCSPDGRWVVFQRGISADQQIWRVPLNGGKAEPLTGFRAKWPAISTDGKRIAFFYMANDKWQIGVISANGGPILTSLENPNSSFGRPIYWARDDNSLYYIRTVGDVGNIWSLPLDGTSPHGITKFTGHRLEDFAFSPDHNDLAVTRSTRLSDVFMFTSSLR